jgi:hypothetical protein
MAQHVHDFAASVGQWAGVNTMDIEGLSARDRFEVHALAASLGLFTQSTGSGYQRILHVYRKKPAGWVPHVPKASMRDMREFAPELFKDDLWAGGDRDYIGDCADCGVELYGYDDERNDDEDGVGAELFCQRCGGDTLSKWELMR